MKHIKTAHKEKVEYVEMQKIIVVDMMTMNAGSFMKIISMKTS